MDSGRRVTQLVQPPFKSRPLLLGRFHPVRSFGRETQPMRIVVRDRHLRSLCTPSAPVKNRLVVATVETEPAG